MIDSYYRNHNYVIYKHNNYYVLLNVENGRFVVLDNYEDAKQCITNTNDKYTELLNKYNFFIDRELYHNPTLQLYTTNKCNLRCRHCYMRCESGLNNELTTIEIIKLLDDFKLYGGQRVIFTGGEFSLREDMIEIVRHSKEIGLNNVLITNGINWTDSMIEEVSKWLDRIQVSVDGYNEETNSKIRGKNTFNKALDTIDRFLKYDLEVLIGVTPLYGYDKDKANYIKFGNELLDKYKDKKNIMIDFPNWVLTGREVESDMELNYQYAKTSVEVLNAIIPGYELAEFASSHISPIQSCGYGKLVVDSDGDFTFCTCVKDIPHLGNIRNMDMKDIMELSKIVSKKTRVDHLEPCKDCDFRYVCGGGCRIGNYKNANNISNVTNMKTLERKAPCKDEYIMHLLDLMVESFNRGLFNE